MAVDTLSTLFTPLAPSVGSMREAITAESAKTTLETLAKTKNPLLKTFVLLSLEGIDDLVKRKSPSETKKELGAAFIKESLKTALELLAENPPKDTAEYLTGLTVYYQLFVAAPLEATRLDQFKSPDQISSQEFIECFFGELDLGIHKKLGPKEKSFLDSLKEVRKTTAIGIRGLLGELMAFCYCRNYSPEPATVSQDVGYGADFYITKQFDGVEYRIPVQVKASLEEYDFRPPVCEFSQENGRAGEIRITLNPPRLFIENQAGQMPVNENGLLTLAKFLKRLHDSQGVHQSFDDSLDIAAEKWYSHLPKND